MGRDDAAFERQVQGLFRENLERGVTVAELYAVVMEAAGEMADEGLFPQMTVAGVYDTVMGLLGAIADEGPVARVADDRGSVRHDSAGPRES
jgi:hypothetical protein